MDSVLTRPGKSGLDRNVADPVGTKTMMEVYNDNEMVVYRKERLRGKKGISIQDKRTTPICASHKLAWMDGGLW